jgi:hypothetical protein
MAVLKKKTPEEKAARAALKEQEFREAGDRLRAAQIEEERRAFFRTPAGEARLAFERGDQVFQYSIDVMNQQAIIVAMVGSTTAQKTKDPVAILNSVCHEGWELVNGSFVFVEQGQQSRDKFMSSGQNVAIKGATVGYYLFKRCEANRTEPAKPWLELDDASGDVEDYSWASSSATAIQLFEDGYIAEAATALRNACTEARSRGDDDELAAIGQFAGEMRAHLDDDELALFEQRFSG